MHSKLRVNFERKGVGGGRVARFVRGHETGVWRVATHYSRSSTSSIAMVLVCSEVTPGKWCRRQHPPLGDRRQFIIIAGRAACISEQSFSGLQLTTNNWSEQLIDERVVVHRATALTGLLMLAAEVCGFIYRLRSKRHTAVGCMQTVGTGAVCPGNVY